MAFLDYQDSHVRIKIHHFSPKYFSSSEDMSLQTLKDDFKLVFVEKRDPENLDAKFLAFLHCHESKAKKNIGTEDSLLDLRQKIYKQENCVIT